MEANGPRVAPFGTDATGHAAARQAFGADARLDVPGFRVAADEEVLGAHVSAGATKIAVAVREFDAGIPAAR